MSCSYNMLTKTAIFDPKKDDIFDVLTELASIDADFNGENGDEYTSDEALEAGFESDLEYYKHLNPRPDYNNQTEVEKYLETFLDELSSFNGYIYASVINIEYNDYYKFYLITYAQVE